MLKVSDVLKKTINQISFLEFGFNYDLFNLTKLAIFLKSDIELQVKKTIQLQTIVMALSRLQRQKNKIKMITPNFQIDKISVFSNLATITFPKTLELYKKINLFHNEVFLKNGYFVISESIQEVTIIFERSFLLEFKAKFTEQSKYQNDNISAVSVKFSEKLFKNLGLLSTLIQKLSFNGINIIEISSTFTEIVFYIDNKDLQLTFEALNSSFL